MATGPGSSGFTSYGHTASLRAFSCPFRCPPPPESITYHQTGLKRPSRHIPLTMTRQALNKMTGRERRCTGLTALLFGPER